MQAGVLLLYWLLAVLLLQQLPLPALLPAALLLLLAAMYGAPRRSLLLLRRVRVLALAIVVLFAWFTPGELLWTSSPLPAPSLEGLALAARHLARLGVVVCALALLLERLGRARLLAGLYTLSQPFARLGLSPERFALRLLLVLELSENAARLQRGQWRQWLEHTASGQLPMPASPAVLVIELESLRPRDRWALLLWGIILLSWSVW